MKVTNLRGLVCDSAELWSSLRVIYNDNGGMSNSMPPTLHRGIAIVMIAIVESGITTFFCQGLGGCPCRTVVRVW
jgi:hypothetical protein